MKKKIKKGFISQHVTKKGQKVTRVKVRERKNENKKVVSEK